MRTSRKKALSLLLALTLLLSFTACSTKDRDADDDTTGKKKTDSTNASTSASTNAGKGLLFEKNDDRKSYYVAGVGTCKDTDIIIPSIYNDLPVTSIGEMKIA